MSAAFVAAVESAKDMRIQIAQFFAQKGNIRLDVIIRRLRAKAPRTADQKLFGKIHFGLAQRFEIP